MFTVTDNTMMNILPHKTLWFFFFFSCFIEVELIYNILLVSGYNIMVQYLYILQNCHTVSLVNIHHHNTYRILFFL